MTARIAHSIRMKTASALRAAGVLFACVVLTIGCEQEKPRTFNDFMEDGLAREGVLARCNRDRRASGRDVECEAARRAAIAVAAQVEEARKAGLELESERKMLAMRDQLEMRDRAAAQAAAEAEAARVAAYEAQWRDPSGPAAERPAALPPASAAGLAADSDPFAEFVPVVPPLEVAAVNPPLSDFRIMKPELEIELADVTIIPRPFRNDEDTAVPH